VILPAQSKERSVISAPSSSPSYPTLAIHSSPSPKFFCTRSSFNYPLAKKGRNSHVQFAIFLDHAIDLNFPQFRSGLFSAKGTFLWQPRVERRDSANVVEPWEMRLDRPQRPNGGGPCCHVCTRLGSPLWGLGVGWSFPPGVARRLFRSRGCTLGCHSVVPSGLEQAHSGLFDIHSMAAN